MSNIKQKSVIKIDLVGDDEIIISEGDDDDDNDDDVMIINTEEDKKDMISVSSDSDIDNTVDNDNIVNDLHLNMYSTASDDNVSDVIANNRKKLNWNNVASPASWTRAMKKYYNKSCKRQRYFDWKTILREIRSSGPAVYWQILESDVYPIMIKRRKCLICRQSDHLTQNCDRKGSICTMCGVPGHFYFKCPQTMCLNCGTRSNQYIKNCTNCFRKRTIKCDDCHTYGHERKNCPDLWRRFHSTVAFKGLNSDRTKLNNNLHCCNCARSGHLYEQCEERYWSTYLPNSSLVTNYKDDNNTTASVTNSVKNRYKRPRYDQDLEMPLRKRSKYDHNYTPSRQNAMNFRFNFNCFPTIFKRNKKKRKKKNKMVAGGQHSD